LGEVYSAIPAFKKVIELDPKHLHAAYNLGIIYFNKAQYELAISYFIMSYNIDSNLLALGHIITSYQNLKNYALAFHYDSIMLIKEPGKIQTLIHMSMMHSDLGVQYANHREFDKAIEEFKMGLLCDSNSANAIGNIGMVYLQTGDKEKAKEYFKKALLKDPGNEVFRRDLELINN